MADAEELPYKDAPFIVFTDFDGTITLQDSNDFLTDTLGYGVERRRQGMQDCLDGKLNFRDLFTGMLKSVSEKNTFSECEEAVRQSITLDPGFKDFFEWSKKAHVPVVIVSSGTVQIIRAILSHLLEPEDVQRLDIIANEAIIHDDGTFDVKFRHPDSGYGHDKSKALRAYRELSSKPTIFFCGDGVSDMSAAGESDLLFVKYREDGSKSDLAVHCDRNKFDYIPFTTFTQVRDHVRSVVEGQQSLDDLNQQGRRAAAAGAIQ